MKGGKRSVETRLYMGVVVTRGGGRRPKANLIVLHSPVSSISTLRSPTRGSGLRCPSRGALGMTVSGTSETIEKEENEEDQIPSSVEGWYKCPGPQELVGNIQKDLYRNIYHGNKYLRQTKGKLHSRHRRFLGMPVSLVGIHSVA